MSNTTKTFLHEILQKPISGSRPKGGVSVEGDIPSFGGENITMSGTINFYPVRKITTEFFNSMKRGHLKDLDVIINKDGANTGKSAIYRNSPYSKAAINEHLFILRGSSEKIDQIYLHYSLLFPKTKSAIEARINGSAQPGLNSNFIQNLPVKIFPLPEQKKIASILTSVDEVIENTQKQIEKLQNLKKATMNELLTKGIGHTEFEDSDLGKIPKNWGVKKLEEVGQIIGGGTPASENENYWGGEIQWATPKEITRLNGRYIEKTERTLTKKGLEESSAKLHPKGTIFLTSRASIGFPAINTVPMATNQGFQSLQPNKRLDTEFGYQILLHNRQKLERLSAGSTFLEISSKEVKKFKLSIPPLPEQKKIASILTSMDKNIEDKWRKLHKIRSLKKSLMQDLLTGKVRVKVN